ncbi:prevent-host-death family protein [Thermus oshimai JL-2]|uniref:Antitoxin n=1 Tax=Thermus oshimai JL-2 TaxID=751945 RepID=K7QYZ6_THEOS|nr:type II toxin-antitoxin system Phd/YefM family antitoxin [Thermus oshimai]AFV76000.1 prevent-host-death family protein [Thermus oshimai JL-2]
MERIWPLQEAKARFSEVVERALRGMPQVVSRRGKERVVLLRYEDYLALKGETQSLLAALRPPEPLEEELVEALFRREEAPYREAGL